jgi:hypothetical protein
MLDIQREPADDSAVFPSSLVSSDSNWSGQSKLGCFRRSKRRPTMDSPIISSANRRLFIVSCIVLGTVLLSTVVLTSGARRSQEKTSLPTLKDNSGSLSFVSVERLDDKLFVMRMKNTSKKTITAFGRAVCDFPESSTDYSIGDHSIGPGEVIEITMHVRVLADKCDPAITQPTITILAVIFDDKTYGGEFRWAKGILDDRRGTKIQLERINELFAKALKWPDVNQPAAIDRLKAEIKLLPIDKEEAPVVGGGFSTANQRVSYLLEELKRWHQSSLDAQSVRRDPIRAELAGINGIKEGIEKLIKLNEKWISRY